MLSALLLASALMTGIQADGKIGTIEKQMVKKFYYKNKPVNPRIIQAFSTWMSDNGDHIVAIDLSNAQNSNRFYCEKEVKIRQIKKNRDIVSLEGKDNEWFGYMYIGQTTSGVIVLRTMESGGGSGVFNNLMLLKLERDHNIAYDEKNNIIKAGTERLVLKKLGEIPLSDRWDGTLQIKGNSLLVTKEGDASNMKLPTVEKRVIRIESK